MVNGGVGGPRHKQPSNDVSEEQREAVAEGFAKAAAMSGTALLTGGTSAGTALATTLVGAAVSGLYA